MESKITLGCPIIKFKVPCCLDVGELPYSYELPKTILLTQQGVEIKSITNCEGNKYRKACDMCFLMNRTTYEFDVTYPILHKYSQPIALCTKCVKKINDIFDNVIGLIFGLGHCEWEDHIKTNTGSKTLIFMNIYSKNPMHKCYNCLICKKLKSIT
jgi:hypothetical protein